MGRPTKGKSARTKSIAVRMTEKEHAEFISKARAARKSTTDFLLAAVENTQVVVPASQSASPERDQELMLKALRYLNATSNNINQIAHRLHTDHLGGAVTERTYLAILENLSYIQQYMKQAVL